MKTKLLCAWIAVVLAVLARDLLAAGMGLVFASSLLASGRTDRD